MKPMRFVLSCLLPALLLSSGCTSSDKDESPEGFVNQGWIWIELPTEDPTYETSAAGVSLFGKAFVSPDHWHCCPVDPAVMVTWSNAATGESGLALSEGYSDFILKIPKHRWIAVVSLAEGDNPITVTAVDPDGHHGEDSITVTYVPTP